MKIVINCVGWSESMRGVDRYCVELLNALLKMDHTNKYYIFIGSWQNYFTGLSKFDNARIISIRWSSARLLRNFWHAFIFPIRAYKIKPDVVHLPNTMPLFFKICPTVCTVHDLLEYICPETFGVFQTWVRKIIVRRETELADIIVTVSNLARDSLIEILNLSSSKIRVIYSGVNKDRKC